jgi:tetratricopeptide (TPR) repeat protein
MDDQDPKSGSGNKSKDSGSSKGSKPSPGRKSARSGDEKSGTGSNPQQGKGQQKGAKKNGFNLPHSAASDNLTGSEDESDSQGSDKSAANQPSESKAAAPEYPGPAPSEYPGSESDTPPRAVLPPDAEALKGYPAGFGPPPFPYNQSETAGPTVSEHVSQWEARQQQGQGQIAPGYGVPVWMPPYGWVLVPYTGEPDTSNPESPSAIQSSLPQGVLLPGVIHPGAVPPEALTPGAIPLAALPPGMFTPSQSNPNLPAQQAPGATPPDSSSGSLNLPGQSKDSDDTWVQTDENLPVFDENEPQEPIGSGTPAATLDSEEELPQDSTRAVSNPGKPSTPITPFVSGGRQEAAQEPPQDATGKVSGGMARTFVPHVDPGDASGEPPPSSNSAKLRSPYVQPAKPTLGQEARDEARSAWGHHVASEYEFDDDTPSDPFTTAHLPVIADPEGGGKELPPFRKRRSLIKTMAIVAVGAVVATFAVGAMTFPLWKESLESAGVDLDQGVVGLLRMTKPEEERLALAAQDAARAGDDWAAIELSTKLIEKYPANAEAYLLRARAEMQLRTFKRAVEDFLEVKRLAPSHTMARLLLAHCLVKIGEPEQAIAECNDVENNLSNPVEQRLFLHAKGLAKMKERHYSEASIFLERASKLTPESATIYSDYAESLLKLEELTKAEDEAGKAIELNKDIPEPYYIIGQVKRKQNRDDEALKYFDDARRLRPQDIDYCIGWATLAAARGRLTDALDALGDLEQSHPSESRLKRVTNDIAAKLLDSAIARIKNDKDRKDFGAWTDFAYARRKMKKLDDAYKATEVAILRNKEYGRAYLYRAQICSQIKGKSQQAVKDAGTALAKDPTLVNAYFTRAFALTDLKKYDQAIQNYQRYIKEKDRPNADAEHNIGLCYHMTRRFDEAIDHYSKAIEIDPSNSQYYTIRADAHRKLGQFDDALQDLKGAIAYDDRYPPAYRARAELWMVLNDYDRAADDYIKYDQLQRKDPEAVLATADALLKSGNPRDALVYCRRAMEEVAKWSTPYLKSAECYVALNDDPAALVELNTGLKFGKRKGVLSNKKAEIYLNMRDYNSAVRFAADAKDQAPEWNWPRLVLAVASLYAGDKSAATRDIEDYIKASGSAADQVTGAIWEFFIQAKSTGDVYKARGILKDRLGTIQYSEWPMPVAKFLAGDLDKDALLRDAKTPSRQTEAHTFVGLFAKLKSDSSVATSELAWVRENGDRNTLAYSVAIAELD